MPLRPGNSRATISHNIDELTHHGSRKRPHNQIVVIALHNADEHPKAASGGQVGIAKLASGGISGAGLSASPFQGDQAQTVNIDVPQITPSVAGPLSGGIPYGLQLAAIQEAQKAQQIPQTQIPLPQAQTPQQGVEKYAKGGVMGILNPRPPRGLARMSEPMVGGGFLHSAIPGRTDALATRVRGGSHVIPADVVSSLGQGNSLAGAKHLDYVMRSLPEMGFASGGHVHPHRRPDADHEPVLLAGGEYVVTPEEVRALGSGDQKKGHDILDKMIVRVRKKEANKMLKLPGPKK